MAETLTRLALMRNISSVVSSAQPTHTGEPPGPRIPHHSHSRPPQGTMLVPDRFTVLHHTSLVHRIVGNISTEQYACVVTS